MGLVLRVRPGSHVLMFGFFSGVTVDCLSLGYPCMLYSNWWMSAKDSRPDIQCIDHSNSPKLPPRDVSSKISLSEPLLWSLFGLQIPPLWPTYHPPLFHLLRFCAPKHSQLESMKVQSHLGTCCTVGSTRGFKIWRRKTWTHQLHHSLHHHPF